MRFRIIGNELVYLGDCRGVTEGENDYNRVIVTMPLTNGEVNNADMDFTLRAAPYGIPSECVVKELEKLVLDNKIILSTMISSDLSALVGDVYFSVKGVGSNDVTAIFDCKTPIPFSPSVISACGAKTDNMIIYGCNLLTNPNFKINQRNKEGTLTTPGYFVDRWYLKQGSVTVNADGSLTLNGSIVQVLENAVGSNVIAYASAGKASYDDRTRTYTLKGNGETITWAKLKYGGEAALFTPPDLAAEMLRCRRFYRKETGTFFLPFSYTATSFHCLKEMPVMRKMPNITALGRRNTDYWLAAMYGGYKIDDSKVTDYLMDIRGGYIRSITTVSGLTFANPNYYFITNTGYILDAEIDPEEV